MSSQTLTDHDAIRKWTEERGGHPATVSDTADGQGSGKRAGVLRLDFGGDDEGLEEIDWDAWFETFEESKLALVVQDETADGDKSSFNKLVSR